MSAAPTGAGEALPSLEEIENWPTQHLDDAATRWRAAATKSVEMFEQHHRNVVSPAGTEWRGLGNDAAASRAAGDLAVVRYHADVKRESADLAASGATDISAVKRLVLDAINDAEDDGFTVNPDLSVTDARTYDINTIQDRNKAAKEHADFIRFRAQQLVATDALFGRRLAAKAVELQGIKFDGEGGGHGAHVQLVDNKTTASGGDKEKPGRSRAARVHPLSMTCSALPPTGRRATSGRSRCPRTSPMRRSILTGSRRIATPVIRPGSGACWAPMTVWSISRGSHGQRLTAGA